MFLKLDGNKIMGHKYVSDVDHMVEVSDPPLNAGGHPSLVDSEGNYKYKYENEKIIELSKTEIDEHPLKLKKLMKIKIEILLEKENKKVKSAKYKEVKKDQSLSEEEIAFIDEIIAELEA